MKKTAKARTSEEFNRFRDFTKRLIAVPKTEIDQQKAKYEKRKESKTKGQSDD